MKKNKPITKPKKATNAEIDLRVSSVYEMIVKGHTRSMIVRFSSENWGIGERQTEDYIASARKLINENYGEKYRENILEKHLAQLDKLYAKNYANEDFRECRNLIESVSKLLGVGEFNKTKIDHTTQGKPIIINLGSGVKEDETTT